MIRLLFLLLLASPALAHETTRSYLDLTREGAAITAEIRLAFRDIEVVAWMDEDLDGAVTWAETEARQPAITTYLGAVLQVSAGGDCALQPKGARVVDSGGVPYLALRFAGTCPGAEEPLTVTSRLFADVDPDHRAYLTLTEGGVQHSAILGAASPVFQAGARGTGLAAVFTAYLTAGILHLGGGFDHLVFLLLLLLPAVTRGGSKRRALLEVATSVTGFTLAHALTLAAAATELFRPPVEAVSVLVALSILVTALDNIRPVLPGSRASVAAFFGLIHGMGFASVLGGSALTGVAFATALAGFNLGIELAQIAIVGFCGVALFALQGGRRLRVLGSLGGALAGAYWLAWPG